jgi:hypothetical protein
MVGMEAEVAGEEVTVAAEDVAVDAINQPLTHHPPLLLPSEKL